MIPRHFTAGSSVVSSEPRSLPFPMHELRHSALHRLWEKTGNLILVQQLCAPLERWYHGVVFASLKRRPPSGMVASDA